MGGPSVQRPSRAARPEQKSRERRPARRLHYTRHTLRSFEDLGLQTTALSTNRVDAVIQDNGPLLDYANNNQGYFVTAEFETDEAYGFAVQKGNNDELLESANDTIAKLKEDGTYDELYKKWFGKAPAE